MAQPTAAERRKQLMRAAVLDAAATIFARKGYAGTTIEDIAFASGHPSAVIYKLFANKEDLFAQLWTAIAGQLERIFAEHLAVRAPFEQRLDALLARLAELLRRHPDQLTAFLGQRPFSVGRSQSSLERHAFRLYQHTLGLMARLIQQGQRQGALRRGVRAQALAMLLNGLLYEYAYRWATSGKRGDPARHITELRDLFYRGARSGR